MARRSMSWGAFMDIACIVFLGLASLLLYLFGHAVRRGFFCDDDSIRYPVPAYQTISDAVVSVVSFGVPILVVMVTEVVHMGLTKPTSLVMFGWTPRLWMVQCYAQVEVFLFGAGMQLMTVEVAKCLVGRLRPHFLAACLPLELNCSTADHKYIMDYTCTGNTDLIEEARLSFPSGHSALAFYAATFTIMYLQIHTTWKRSKLPKHLLQFLAVMAAWATALTRVSDYMHHWSDVLAGMAFGTLFGILTVLFVSSLRQKQLSSDSVEPMGGATNLLAPLKNNLRVHNPPC